MIPREICAKSTTIAGKSRPNVPAISAPNTLTCVGPVRDTDGARKRENEKVTRFFGLQEVFSALEVRTHSRHNSETSCLREVASIENFTSLIFMGLWRSASCGVLWHHVRITHLRQRQFTNDDICLLGVGDCKLIKQLFCFRNFVIYD